MCYLVVLYWIYCFISMYPLILQCLISEFFIFSYFFLLIHSLHIIIFLIYFFNFLFLQSILCCASISLKVLLISSCTSFEIHLIIKKRDLKPLLNDYWIFLNIFIFFHLCCARSKYFLIFSQKLSFFLAHLHTILFISIYL
jgi:hypothetical protein